MRVRAHVYAHAHVRVRVRACMHVYPATTAHTCMPCYYIVSHVMQTPTTQPKETPADQEEMQEVMEEFDRDYEFAQGVRVQLLPKAVLWYTGEAVEDEEDGEEDEDEDEDEDSDEDSEDEEDIPPPRRGKKKKGGKGGLNRQAGSGPLPGVGGNKGGDPEECKQS